jgi:lipoprotein signal peptidase
MIEIKNNSNVEAIYNFVDIVVVVGRICYV